MIELSWISQEDLKAIKAQADIVDIVSSYVQVEKKGSSYRALCPFHDDHDPSLHIDVKRQTARCFVCGSGGDVFGFVSKIEQLTFPQAVARVAEIIHYPLAANPISARPKKEWPLQKEYDVMDSYVRFCCYELDSQDGTAALDYLEKRKISKEIIEKFSIGYAPAANYSLHFLQSKYSEETLVKCGLVWISEYGIRPVFTERIMIPIHDLHGHPVGFTARRLLEDESAKYVNSPQSEIYNKSSFIFNYHRAKEICRQTGRVILCEGAMDVIGLAKAGMYEGIANLGTACTSEQITAIAKLRVPVAVFYDSDKAGREACYKFGKMAAAAGIRFSIVNNTLGKDPDEIFNQFGEAQLKAAADKTISWVQFLFDYLPEKYNLENYEDKKEFARQIDAAIKLSPDRFERQSYYEKLKSLCGFDLALQEPKPGKKTKRQQPVLLPDPRNGMEAAQKSALYVMLHSKQAALRFQQSVGYFVDPVCNLLSLYIYDIYRSKDQIDPYELLAMIEQEPVILLLNELMQNPYSLDVTSEELFDDVIAKMEESALNARLDQINERLAQIDDPDEKIRLALEKRELIQRRHKVRDQKEG